MIDIAQIAHSLFSSVLLPPQHKHSFRVKTPNSDYGHDYLYDELFSLSAYQLEGAINWTLKNGGPVLDLGCGTGTFACALANRGVETVALDNSQSMIQKAKSVAAAHNQNPTFLHASMDSFELREKRFRTITSLNNALAHVSTLDGIKRALVRLRLHLQAEGCLAFDVHNWSYWNDTGRWHSGTWRYIADQETDKGRFRVWRKTSLGAEEGQTVWEHAISRFGIRFVLLNSPIFVLPLQKWRDLLEVSGFQLLSASGDWRDRALDGDCPNLVLRAKRL